MNMYKLIRSFIGSLCFFWILNLLFIGLFGGVFAHAASHENPDRNPNNYYSMHETEGINWFRDENGILVSEYRSGFRFRHDCGDPKIVCNSVDDGCDLPEIAGISLYERGCKPLKFFIPPGTIEARFTMNAGKSSKTMAVGRFKQPPVQDYRNISNYGYDDYDDSNFGTLAESKASDQHCVNKGGTIGGMGDIFSAPLSESESGWYYILFVSNDGWVNNTRVDITLDRAAYMEWFNKMTAQGLWDSFESYGGITPVDDGGAVTDPTDPGNNGGSGDDSPYGGGDSDGDQDPSGDSGSDGSDGDDSSSPYGGGDSDGGSNDGSQTTSPSCLFCFGTCIDGRCVYDDNNQNSGETDGNGTDDNTDYDPSHQTPGDVFGGGGDGSASDGGSDDVNNGGSDTDAGDNADSYVEQVVTISCNANSSKVLTSADISNPDAPLVIKPDIRFSNTVGDVDFFAALKINNDAYMVVKDEINPTRLFFVDFVMGDRLRHYKTGSLAGMNHWVCDAFRKTVFADNGIPARQIAELNAHFLIGFAPKGEVPSGNFDNLKYIDISVSPAIAE